MSFGATLTKNDEGDFGAGDFFCVEAVVARNDDPENRCRVQCVIPIIDEIEIHEIWARRLQIYVGENGFGDYFVPEVGAEIMVLGRLGDTNHLFYAPLWNEERKPSPDFPDQSVAGWRVPHNLKVIAEELARMQAHNIEAIAAQVAKILAQNVEITAQQSAKLKGNNATVEASGTALLKGNQVNVNGSTITIQSDGSISITSGGAVSISGASVTIENRPVRKVGPAI